MRLAAIGRCLSIKGSCTVVITWGGLYTAGSDLQKPATGTGTAGSVSVIR